MKTTTFDLLRHGAVQGGVRFRGNIDDPLSTLGWQQMQQQTAGLEWDAVISSPLTRCHRFASEFCIGKQIKLITENDLREIGFGHWEGKTAGQISKDDPLAIVRFYQDPVNNTPPEGEPYRAFSQRIESVLGKIISNHRGQHILIITHGGVIRTLFSQILAIPIHQTYHIDIPYACLSRFRCFHDNETDFVQLIFHKPL